LVYNEQMQAFTSLYDSAFDCSMKFTDKLYLVNGDIYEWNKRSTSTSPEGTNGYMPAYVKYVINEQPYGVKVFDNVEFNGNVDTTKLNFTFTTSNNQSGSITNGNGVTVREGEYRFAIPRNNNANYGERLKGKTMQCELTSSSGDFSLQYINTKYRMS